jgi:predicted nucleic acid-binding protein
VILTDSRFWLALADESSPAHVQALQTLRYYDKPLFTTEWVVADVAAQLLPWGGIAPLTWMRAVARVVTLCGPSIREPAIMTEYLQRYIDFPLSTSDASLLAAAEAPQFIGLLSCGPHIWYEVTLLSGKPIVLLD